MLFRSRGRDDAPGVPGGDDRIDPSVPDQFNGPENGAILLLAEALHGLVVHRHGVRRVPAHMVSRDIPVAIPDDEIDFIIEEDETLLVQSGRPHLDPITALRREG